MTKFLMAVLACAGLAGCAAPAPQNLAQNADASACTAQADAVYDANTLDEQARTGQNGLLYGATPTHVFDGEQLGAQHVRDSQITQCEQNGNRGEPDAVNGMTVATPHIVATP